MKETSEPKKKQEKKAKLPSIIKRFLGTKKKASRQLRRKENLMPKQIRKLLEKIYRAKTAIKNYYKERQENQEKHPGVASRVGD